MIPDELFTEFNSTLIILPTINKEELYAYLLTISHEPEMVSILHWVWYEYAKRSVDVTIVPEFIKTEHIRDFFQVFESTCLTSTLDLLIGIHHAILVEGKYEEPRVWQLLEQVKLRLYYLLTTRLSYQILNKDEFIVRKEEVKRSGYTKRQLCEMLEQLREPMSEVEYREEARDFVTEVNETCVFYVAMYLLDIDKYMKSYYDIKNQLYLEEDVELSRFRDYLFATYLGSESGALLDTLVTLYYDLQIREADRRVYKFRNPNSGGEPTSLMLINMKNVELINMEITSLEKMRNLILENEYYMKLFTDACFMFASRSSAYANNDLDVYVDACKYIKYEPITRVWYFKHEDRLISNFSFTGAFVLSRKVGLGNSYFDKHF